MKNSLRCIVALCISGTVGVQAVQAQTYVVPAVPQYAVTTAPFSQAELDAMLAPIALYPDALLSQILMAATYPLEVAEAARWSRAIPGVAPQEAVRSVARRGWDASVQSLMAFPQVLAMMDASPEWTRRLGDAFLTQQDAVWATVQALRQRAVANGQLRSTDQLRVLHNGPVIVLEPAQPEVVYVPYYDPLVIYGRWWWPGYAPMRWDPWPGYAVRPGWGVGFYTGSGVRVGFDFFFGWVNWDTRRAIVIPREEWHDRYSRPWEPHHDWRHDPQHRHNVPYISPTPRPQPVPQPVPQPRPEFRGRMPNPAVQVEPLPSRPPEHRRPNVGPAPGAPMSPAPAPTAPRPRAPQTPPNPGYDAPSHAPHAPPQDAPRAAPMPVPAPTSGPTRNAPPSSSTERPVSHAPAAPRAPTESRPPAEPKAPPAPPRKSGMRPEDFP